MPEIVWPEGLKKTKQRDAVVKILESAEAPLSAPDIYAQIEKDGQAVWLSTVYRILELFTEKGLVTKTPVLDGDMAYYELRRHDHRHYAVCVDCHKIVPIQDCPMTGFEPKISDDFRVLGHRIEMYGYCKDCDKRNKSSKE
ncbi:Fur family transcriptional regulator, ferric uptake regulator [Sporobacter termitidis DSM 10068]|uniref:Fur family transcriptional regulator, ferric uptake regulator n=1 Tax=Sporobacter termitidis DSM 10068 TaxID=1123282 RepID=A0A1M5ZGR8_9FIRM|nr:transcriptional repressor [Sporobacter termitidis]SHI23374.1 Fur family transcriptional regulator, ferric uptake regulator [Sporobacter termitidis DSM 10068]